MLTVCHNPFQPEEDQQHIALLPAETVGGALEREGLDGRYVLSCNGELLPPERALAYVPREGDDIQAVPVLENSTLKSIALIGVAIGAAFLTAGLSSALAPLVAIGGLSQTAATAIAYGAGAIATIGGQYAVKAVASLFTSTPGGNNYGVLRPSSTARSGIPIPKGLRQDPRGREHCRVVGWTFRATMATNTTRITAPRRCPRKATPRHSDWART